MFPVAPNSRCVWSGGQGAVRRGAGQSQVPTFGAKQTHLHAQQPKPVHSVLRFIETSTPHLLRPHRRCPSVPHMVRPQPWGGWEVPMPTLIVAVYGRHAVAVGEYSFAIELWGPGAGRSGKQYDSEVGLGSPWCSPPENKLVGGRGRVRDILRTAGGAGAWQRWPHALGVGQTVPAWSRMLGRPQMEQRRVRKLTRVGHKA